VAQAAEALLAIYKMEENPLKKDSQQRQHNLSQIKQQQMSMPTCLQLQ